MQYTEDTLQQIRFFLKELTKTQNKLPKWVRQKADYLLNPNGEANIAFLTGEEILAAGIEFFKIEKPENLTRRYRYKDIMLKRHIIRYTMYMNGIHFNDIAKIFKTDRTTNYRSIYIVNELSSVDLEFRQMVNGFIKYINTKKNGCENSSNIGG